MQRQKAVCQYSRTDREEKQVALQRGREEGEEGRGKSRSRSVCTSRCGPGRQTRGVVKLWLLLFPLWNPLLCSGSSH